MAEKFDTSKIDPQELSVINHTFPAGMMMVNEDLTLEYRNSVVNNLLSLGQEDGLIDLMAHIDPRDQILFKDTLEKYFCNDPSGTTWMSLRLIDAAGIEKPIIMQVTPLPPVSESQQRVQLIILPFFEQDFQETVFSLINQLGSDRYHAIFESLSVGVGILDDKGVFFEVNRALTEMLRLEKKSIVKQHYTEIIPDEKSILENALMTILEGETRLVKRQILFKHEDGSRRIFHLSLSQMVDLDSVMLTLEDITDRENTHQALIQSEKLSLTGRLAASLAHEINNPLQTSIGCLGLAEEMLDETQADLQTYIHLAMEELKRSARIVKRLRDLNRTVDADEKEWIDLRGIVQDVFILTKSKLQDRGIIPVFPKGDPRLILFGSRDQIQQVILNIVMNAIDVMPKGGNIYMDFIQTQDPEGVQLKIRDTGPGMDQDKVSRIFDPFFTTKDDGLGLGLFICKRIVEEHQGTIRVNSMPGKGTEFIIWFPMIDPAE